MIIPRALIVSCAGSQVRTAWLERLPVVVGALSRRWSISVEADQPFEASAAWVAPATCANGTAAVLKLSMPHMEAEHEIDGLRFWAGDPTVQLLEWDVSTSAMLLERCNPGTPLRTLPEPEQDHVIAALLHRMWRSPGPSSAFRPLSVLVRHWCSETLADVSRWPDVALVRQGLDVFHQLITSPCAESLLATDLHAGNVLRAERRPWLAIDPKPFIGDVAFDATQHVLNCRVRLRTDATGIVARMANLLGVEPDRVRLWLFARLAAEPRDVWDGDSLALARSIQPPM